MPKVKFSIAVRLDPRQQIERHGLDVSLSSEAVAVDIDILQHVLKMFKVDREPPRESPKAPGGDARESGNAADAIGMHQPSTKRVSWMIPQSPPLRDGSFSPPPTSPRFGWTSPMSPNSPLLEALSVWFSMCGIWSHLTVIV